MIDSKAFRVLSYGLYLISSASSTERAGCVVNTFAQVTSKPAQASIAINKDNHTTSVIREAGRFCAAVLDESAPMELIGTFGFKTSTETDKFADVEFATDAAGIPYVAEHVCARFSVRVTDEIDLGSHVLFIGEVEESEPLGSEAPMTYAYYHKVKGGKTPPKASSFEPESVPDPADEPMPDAADAPTATRIAWRCRVCGYIEYADELPDDFTCPVCGQGKDMFERIEV